MTLPHHIISSLPAIGILAALAPRGPAVDPVYASGVPPAALPMVITVAYETVAPPTPEPRVELDLPTPVSRPKREEPETIRMAKPIFREEGVPEQFAWIAVVESSLNPRARSRAGAVGLYQLMPETARELGLRVNRRVDERYDAERNARAAARYLASLYDRFGSWRLALAAYNAGPTRIARLLRRHRARSYNAIAQRLPRETREYVPKIFAAISRYESAGATPPTRTLALGRASESNL